jgi:hypothetical protein
VRSPLRRGAALLGLLGLLCLLVACTGGGGDGDEGTATPPAEEAPGGDAAPALPPLVEPAASFVASVAGDDVTFTAEYRVLRKLGSVESDVSVAQDPPWREVRAGDLVVRSGPQPATCRPSAGRCVGQVREEALAAAGVFSGFATTATADNLTAIAARPDATATPSTRTAAGVELRCLDVAVQGTRAGRWCLTPEGVFGFVDTVVARYELQRYATTADVVDEPPGELVADDAFLRGG